MSENENEVSEVEATSITLVDPDTGTEVEHQIDEDGNPYVQHEGYRSVLKGFGGEKKGLSYYVDEYDSNEAAALQFSPEVILNCLNNELANTIKRRVMSSKVPSFEDKDATASAIKKLIASDPLLFTMAEAHALVPGERERTMTTIERELKECRKNGDFAAMAALLAEYSTLMQKQREKEGINADEEDEA